MSDSSRPAPRRLRWLLAAVLGTLVAALTPVLAPTLAAADPAPTATAMDISSLSTPSITVPQTAGTPAYYIVRDIDFRLEVAFTDGAPTPAPLPLSYTKDVTIGLQVLAGPNAGTVWKTTVPAGQTSAVFEQHFTTAGNGAVVQVTNLARRPRDLITSETVGFDVLKSSAPALATSDLTGIGGGGGTGTACTPTRQEPVCADLLLPDGVATGDGLLSLGICDTLDACTGQSVQVLIGLVQDRSNPATLVMKCDKSQCRGGGIGGYTLNVTLVPGTPALSAPSCPAKGTVGADQSFCIDYVQSTRDNAGDTHLYLLFVEDAKVRFP
jgi:hypothetical protein